MAVVVLPDKNSPPFMRMRGFACFVRSPPALSRRRPTSIAQKIIQIFCPALTAPFGRSHRRSLFRFKSSHIQNPFMRMRGFEPNETTSIYADERICLLCSFASSSLTAQAHLNRSENHPDFLPSTNCSLWSQSPQVALSFQILSYTKPIYADERI